jgi:hypothetical protein
VLKSRRLRWEWGTCSTYGEKKFAYRFWWGDLRKKRLLERPKHKWDVNIKTDIKEVVWEHRLD